MRIRGTGMSRGVSIFNGGPLGRGLPRGYFARKAAAEVHDGEAGDGGGATGDNGNGGGGGEGDGEDGEDKGETEVMAYLREAGREFGSLPADVQAAVRAGTADVQLVRRVVEVEALWVIGALAKMWPGLRNRLVANRRLPIQLGVELTVGSISKTLAELQGRGDAFWSEFDFYLSDLALELVGDAMLVWLLCPVAAFAATANPGFLARLPKHAAQIGGFALPERVAALVFKGAQFGAVGFVSSLVGHGLTTTMVRARGKKQHGGKELAPLIPTSLTWGGFLMASSNPRYQLVNALEQRVLDPLLGRSAVLLTGVTFGVRFGNCLLGGVQWLPWARFWGLQ